MNCSNKKETEVENMFLHVRMDITWGRRYLFYWMNNLIVFRYHIKFYKMGDIKAPFQN